MKKLLLSVIAFALITTSCNKYKDDFKNLNARLDALSAQVAGVNTLVTGLAGLSAQITSLQAAITAIPNNTAAITALQTGLTALAAQVTAINTALTNLATTVTNGNASTATLIANLTTLVNSNQTALTAANTALTALINANQTTNAASFASIITLLNSIIATQTAQSATLATINTANAATNATVGALQTQLAIANLNIAILLANSQFYEGTLTIFDEATLAFAETLLNRIALIKGDVTINTTALSAGQKTRLDVVAGKMFSIIGDFTYTGAGTTFTNLTSISGDVSFTVTGNVNVPALTSVGGNYTVTGADITDTALASVLGNVSLSYPNGYSSTSLTSIGGTFTLVVNGTTTTVNFPNLTSTGLINGGTLSFPLATTVNLGAGDITSLSAPVATSVRLGQAQYSGALTISAVLATSIDLSAADSTTGALSVTGKAGSTVNLANYRNGAGGGLTITGPTTQDIPKYTAGVLTSTTIKTITLAKYTAASTFAGLSILENITLGDVRNPVIGLATTLKTINATGIVVAAGSTPAPSTITLGAAYTALTTVSFAGEWDQVIIDLSGVDVLASVTTTGIINLFKLSNTDILTSVSLGHTHHIGGPGSTLWVNSNAKLTSLTSSTDFATSVQVIGNPLMTSINLASYVNVILGGSVDFQVYNNKNSGLYENAIEGTATTAFVMTKIHSADIMTFKAYVQLLDGISTPATVIYRLGIWDVFPAVGAQSVDFALTNDTWYYTTSVGHTGEVANVVGTDINTTKELSLVQL